jgi:hypothetical protein
MAVRGGVVLTRFLRVMRGLVMVAGGDMSMMPSLLVISRFMMFGCRAMMASGMFVMFSSF